MGAAVDVDSLAKPPGGGLPGPLANAIMHNLDVWPLRKRHCVWNGATLSNYV